MSEKPIRASKIVEELKEANNPENVEDSPEAARIQILETENKNLKEELDWIKGEYALTLDSMFDALFEISYQVKHGSLKEIYKQRIESVQQRIMHERRMKRPVEKPTS